MVLTSQNWGFCSSSCSFDDYFAKVLQETKITVLTDNECKVFDKDYDLEDSETEDSNQLYVPGTLNCNCVFSWSRKWLLIQKADKNDHPYLFSGEEFCSGLKIPWSKTKVYERRRSTKDGNKKYSFKYRETIPNKVPILLI